MYFYLSLFRIRIDRFKIADFWEDLCPRLEEDDFRSYFRMYTDTFRALVKWIKPKRRELPGGRTSVSPSKQVAMTLNFVGSQCTMKHLSKQFGVSPSTFCDIVHYIMSLVTTRAHEIIRWPERDEYAIHAAQFNKKRRKLVNI